MANRKLRLAKESAIRMQQADWRLRLQQHNRRKKLAPALSLRQWQILLEADFIKSRLPKHFRTRFIQKTADLFRNFMKQSLGIHTELKNYRQRQIVAELVAHRVTRRMMSEFRYQILIFRICRVGNIVRPIRDWRPPHSKQMDILLWHFFKHLCVRYKGQMPLCFRALILRHGLSNPCNYNPGNGQWTYRYQDLQIAFWMANGKGIHEMKMEETVGINSRTQYHFFQAPKRFQSFYLILQWARLRSLKLSKILADYFTDEYWDYSNLIYETELIRFFNRYPDLDPEQAVHIYEFVKSQKSISSTVEGFEIRPLFPDFTFKKRTLASVFRSIKKWRSFVEAHIAACSQKPVPASDVRGFEKSISEQETIRVEQLLTLGALRLEGFYMQHCVATYFDNCIDGECTIWSVKRHSKGEEPVSLATIELSNAKEIIQLNGRFNGTPPTFVRQLVREWAKQESLNVSLY